MRILRSMLAAAARRGGPKRSLLKDENGATAVEFGMIAMPFLLFVLGILGMGLYYLAAHFARVRRGIRRAQNPHG